MNEARPRDLIPANVWTGGSLRTGDATELWSFCFATLPGKELKMTSKMFRLGAFIVLLFVAPVVSANYCALDEVPAATLLFPFVAFDYEGGYNGQTTQIAITNVSSEAQIVHVTIWSDYSVAILDFNVVLTGYDVVRMNTRDILAFGLLPTEDEATSRKDNIWVDDDSNAGGTPFDDGPWSTHNELHDPPVVLSNLPDPESTTPLDCDPDDWISSPVNYVDPIPPGTLGVFEGYLKASQTSARSYLDCADEVEEFPEETWFIARDSGPVWIYVTADVVASCNKDLPDGQASTYFALDRANTDGVLDDNVLIGDVIWLDTGKRFSEADEAVHLESFGPASDVTFYTRYTLAFDAFADGREPLPSAWAIRYQVIQDDGIDTWIRVFKGSTLNRTVADLASSSVGPNWGSINSVGPANLYASACVPYTYYAWDEDENVNSVSSDEDPWSGTEDPIRPVPNLLPLEVQEVRIDQFFIVREDPDEEFFGWLLLIWPGSNGAPVGNTAGDLDDRYQTWVGARYTGFGYFSAGLSGAVMANFNCDDTQVLPLLGLGQPRVR